MKIDFERVHFDDERKFLLFKSNPEGFYLLRIMDFNGGERFGDTIKNPEDIANGSCVVGEYLISKDEFELWDNDENSFNKLIDTLSKNAPSDRLLKLYYQLNPQSQPVPLQVNIGEATETEINLVEKMKEEFSSKQKEARSIFYDFINGESELDIYFIHSDHLNKIFPAIDFENKVFFTEGEEQAKSFTKATQMFGNQYYKVDSEQAKKLINDCLKYGTNRVVFCQSNGDASIFDIDSLVGRKGEVVYNSDVYNTLIRCIECSGIEEPQVQANQMTLTSKLSHAIFQKAFLVAVNLPKDENKDIVLMSANAENLYNQKEFKFVGAENFKYTVSDETRFNIRTLVNSQDNSLAIPVFTGYEEFTEVFKDNSAVPMAVTIEEVYSMRNENCQTVIVNPAVLGFILSDVAMEQLRDLSKRPLTVFKPQQLTPSQENIQEDKKEVQINVPIVPQPASTEDILHMVANQINKDEAVKKENIVKDDTNKKATMKLVENDKEETIEENIVNTIDVDEIEEEIEKTPKEEIENTESKQEKKGGLFSIFKKRKK